MALTGEWFNQSSRPLMRSQGAVSQDVETCDIADAAVTAAKVAGGIISSEKATAKLRQRSIMLFVEKQTATSSEGWSTSYAAWRPLTNVNILRVQHIALGNYENATCDNYTLYGNAGTSISDVALKAVATAVAAGTRTAGSAIVQAALAACTDIFIKLFGSTCSVPARAAFQIDYESTG